jgi:3-deoxy-7-phosphoheptulonate synthase
MKDLKLASIGARPERTIVRVGDVQIGKDFTVVAGPCSVETEEQTIRTAIAVKEAGANMLRGGRSSQNFSLRISGTRNERA